MILHNKIKKANSGRRCKICRIYMYMWCYASPACITDAPCGNGTDSNFLETRIEEPAWMKLMRETNGFD